MTQASLWVFRLISRTWLSRSESRLHPAPITRVGGKPLCLQATWVMMSTEVGPRQKGKLVDGFKWLRSQVVCFFSQRGSLVLLQTWLGGDEHHGVGAESGQIRDDPSVQVHVSLNHAEVRLLTAPSVCSHHDNTGARRGRQI